MPTTYSNPRLAARIEGWPIGTKRTLAVFIVETHPTRGQQVAHYRRRVPTLPVGSPLAPVACGMGKIGERMFYRPGASGGDRAGHPAMAPRGWGASYSVNTHTCTRDT